MTGTAGERPVTFRPAAADDLASIVALLADDNLGKVREDPSEPLDPRYLAAFDEMAASDNSLQVVADLEGEVIGCLQLMFLPGLSRRGLKRGQIEAVRVARGHRGGGLGETMIHWAIDECRRRGCGIVQLTTDRSRADAHRFYERLGFTASHIGMKLEL